MVKPWSAAPGQVPWWRLRVRRLVAPQALGVLQSKQRAGLAQPESARTLLQALLRVLHRLQPRVRRPLGASGPVRRAQWRGLRLLLQWLLPVPVRGGAAGRSRGRWRRRRNAPWDRKSKLQAPPSPDTHTHTRIHANQRARTHTHTHIDASRARQPSMGREAGGRNAPWDRPGGPYHTHSQAAARARGKAGGAQRTVGPSSWTMRMTAAKERRHRGQRLAPGPVVDHRRVAQATQRPPCPHSAARG